MPIAVASVAAAVAFLAGGAICLLAGFHRGVIDQVLMRRIDILRIRSAISRHRRRSIALLDPPPAFPGRSTKLARPDVLVEIDAIALAG